MGLDLRGAREPGGGQQRGVTYCADKGAASDTHSSARQAETTIRRAQGQSFESNSARRPKTGCNGLARGPTGVPVGAPGPYL